MEGEKIFIHPERPEQDIKELRRKYQIAEGVINRSTAGRELDEAEGTIFETEIQGGSIDTRPTYDMSLGAREFEMLISTGESESKRIIGQITDNAIGFGPAFDLDKNPAAKEEAQKIHERAVEMANHGSNFNDIKKEVERLIGEYEDHFYAENPDYFEGE